jgi:phosphoribosyl-ATP pyrophosphohydrolase/phosphoribosyl-AMP cyclohydrolase
MERVDDLTFDEKGLIPAVVQDAASGEVLMLAYMNEESLRRTMTSGRTHFWSRSRDSLWLKGETSGNIQEVVDIRLDCDQDALLVSVRQRGPACHTGERSCFHRTLSQGKAREERREPDRSPASAAILGELFDVIQSRRENPCSDSYTSGLLASGKERVLKKVGEEAIEVVIASMDGDSAQIIHEVSDLLYHIFVLLAFHELRPEAAYQELGKRRAVKS